MTKIRTTHARPAQTPLTLWECKQEATRLFDLYFNDFSQASEAKYVLHKQYFSIDSYEKEALQNDTIQIARRNFIWDFKYSIARAGGNRHSRPIIIAT
jgi:hypothetical protein